MTDQERITFLRNKLHAIEAAIFGFEDVLDATSPARHEAMAAVVNLDVGAGYEEGMALVRVLEETNVPRAEAWAKVKAAMAMTFAEAVEASPDMTEEQREHWRGVVEREAATATATATE